MKMWESRAKYIGKSGSMNVRNAVNLSTNAIGMKMNSVMQFVPFAVLMMRKGKKIFKIFFQTS